MENIDAMMMSTNEKTFQYQNELPSLPVPPLEQTIRKYLDSGEIISYPDFNMSFRCRW